MNDFLKDRIRQRTIYGLAYLFFLSLVAVKFVSLKIMNEIPVEGEDGGMINYAHPVFQAVCCFAVEFIIVVCIYWPFFSLG